MPKKREYISHKQKYIYSNNSIKLYNYKDFATVLMQIYKSNIKRNQKFIEDLKNFSFLNYIKEIISDILLEVKT